MINRSDYTRKMKELLDDNKTYRPLKMDPTNEQKNKLVTILRRIKTEARLEDSIYKGMYPTGGSPPKLSGLPKNHKKNNLLRPIVSSRCSVTYGIAKELARILNNNNNCTYIVIQILDETTSRVLNIKLMFT